MARVVSASLASPVSSRERGAPPHEGPKSPDASRNAYLAGAAHQARRGGATPQGRSWAARDGPPHNEFCPSNAHGQMGTMQSSQSCSPGRAKKRATKYRSPWPSAAAASIHHLVESIRAASPHCERSASSCCSISAPASARLMPPSLPAYKSVRFTLPLGALAPATCCLAAPAACGPDLAKISNVARQMRSRLSPAKASSPPLRNTRATHSWTSSGRSSARARTSAALVPHALAKMERMAALAEDNFTDSFVAAISSSVGWGRELG
eukprot:CAMPEP_0176308874 /NCGR_PEP_ID=MMETSP0121_2-20121125/64779_1 /TAXON_ID=160619 /ORGANISM="Kryptoperidinium foliaceum, Strain CCMP 1326" /LENGTH=265 /DNA_ID=CAMNT_0017650741 /DNA_START=198 /DNA_END=992 /DNA_ORIENTATION=-